MLPVMSSNNWFPTMFDDFFNNDWMPKMKATAPAVNVKEDAKSYVMELAVPGIKKEYCRVCINNEGNLEVVCTYNLTVCIDYITRWNTRMRTRKSTICVVSSHILTISKYMFSQRMLRKTM